MSDKLELFNSALLSKHDLHFLSGTANSEEAQENFKDYFYESDFWKYVEETATPYDIVEERKGYKDKDGRVKMLEYFPEEYTIGELNRLFPGWWTEDMHTVPDHTFRCVVTSGYLCIRYPSRRGGIMVRKIYAVGASFVEAKADDPTKPSQPDDMYKASRTEWIKLAGKWLGIGLDIYHQKITEDLRRQFEDKIRGNEIYAKNWIDLAKNISLGSSFRKMLRKMPTKEQVTEFEEMLERFDEGKRPALTSTFWTLNNEDPPPKSVTSFLKMMREVLEGKAKPQPQEPEEVKSEEVKSPEQNNNTQEGTFDYGSL